MKLNIVPARTGVTWVKLGMRTFMKQPLAMSGLFLLYMAVGTLLSMVPFLGMFLALVIVPAATLGLMAATQEAQKGKFPMPTVLISAFRAGHQRRRSMLVLGVIYAVVSMLIVFIASQLMDAPVAPDVPAAAAGAAAAAKTGQEVVNMPQFQQMVLLTSAMFLPVSLLFWHAPALVHWHGVSPVKSLFFSLVACIRNIGAFLVYAITWVGVLLGLGLVASLAAALFGSPALVANLMTPLALIFAAMFSTSLFFTFQDCFLPAELDTPLADADQPPPEAP